MAARAVVWNPLSEARGLQQLQIFYNSAKRSIAVRPWSPGDSGGFGVFYQEHVDSPLGNVRVGGGFAALIWRDWIRAYGIIEVKPADGSATAYHISLLSPVPQSLGIATKYNRLAGTSDQAKQGKDKAWLYYLDTKSPPVIHERALEGTGKGTPVAKTTSLMAKDTATTDLAACYSTGLGKRFLFFQSSDGHLHAFDVQAATTDADKNVEGAESARHGTPLAATSFVHGEEDKKDVIVVYWMQNTEDCDIYRSYSINGGDKWFTKKVTTPSKPSPETLAVAPNSTLKLNALVYTTEDAEIEAVTDEWSAFDFK